MREIKIHVENAEYQVLKALLTNRNLRHRRGEFLVEGVRSINEAMAGGWDFRALVSAQGAALSGWARDVIARVAPPVHYLLASRLMADLSGKEQTSELMALIATRGGAPDALLLPETPLVALFDRPSNKGNLGSLIRSCDALGVDALLVTGHAVDLYDPETVVASMGSFFRLPMLHVPEMGALEAWLGAMRTRYPGFAVVGTSAHAQRAVDEIDLTRPSLLMLGNEADGLSGRLRGLCDEMASIPMSPESSASSLNIACAATAVFYEAGRQRRLGR